MLYIASSALDLRACDVKPTSPDFRFFYNVIPRGHDTFLSASLGTVNEHGRKRPFKFLENPPGALGVLSELTEARALWGLDQGASTLPR